MSRGSYAEYAVVPAATARQAAGRHHLRPGRGRDAAGHDRALPHPVDFPLKAGDTCLVHAAAGGAGAPDRADGQSGSAHACSARCQPRPRRNLARDNGADEVIRYTEQDFEAEVKRLTGGRGVDVVYDSVGKTTFDKSLNCLRPRGHAGAVRAVERRGPAVRS